MLKIKSNTNEFTIIFFWEDWKENKCWKIICSTLSIQLQRRTFLCSSPLFLSASMPLSSFLLFWSAPLFSCSVFQCPFSFQFRCSLFCFSVPHFSPALLFLFFRCVALYFSAQKTFFSPNVFSLQPLFSSSFFCFILFWFSPLFFSFQFRCSFFFFSLAPFIQVPMFSLVASHLFYLNKFLISSNLE